MQYLITNTSVSLMYELKNLEWYLRVNLLGPGPRLMKKEFTGLRSHKVEKHWFKGFKCKIGTEYENAMVQNTRGQEYRYVLLVSVTNFKVSRGF